MPTPSEHTRLQLELYLNMHAKAAWPQLAGMHVRHRGRFAYVEGELPGGGSVKLMRLSYNGTASRWGFAIYDPGSDRYQDSLLLNGTGSGTPEDALDTACRLHLRALDI